MRPETITRPTDDASDAEWADYYFAHQKDPDEWSDPLETDRRNYVAEGIQLKYRAPDGTMKRTTAIKPDDWNGMPTVERKKWAQEQCNRVCPGATEISLA